MFSTKSLVLALSLASAVFAADCTRTYTVSAGDICDSISAAQKVSTFQLAMNNNDVNDGCGNLAIGQSLCLGATGLDCTDIYVVKTGDTCASVISSSGANSTAFYANNRQIDASCSNLYTGEVVCVSSDVYAYPSTVVVASDTEPSYIAKEESYESLPFCDEIDE